MALDIFTKELGDTDVVWPTDTEGQAVLGIKVLDAVQTIVDVLSDQSVRYKASFAAADTAYTDHSTKTITITAKPMIEGGRPLDEIAAILTGFAVHEVGHTKEREREFSMAVRAEWPGKVTPHRLANILSDVRLEATVIARFAGLHDVFVPTMEWVADSTCPSGRISYGKTLHDRLNFVGQAVRYSQFVDFAQDPETQSQLRWWQEWGDVSADTDNETMLRLVREAIDHVREGAEYEPTPPPPVETGGTPDEAGEAKADHEDGSKEPTGNPSPGNPDDDFRETEDESDDEGGGEDAGDDAGVSAGKSGDDDGTEGESNGDGDADKAGDGEPGKGDTEGESESESDRVTDGQMDEGETLDRTETDESMGDGAGGTGQAIAENGNPDEGLDEDKLAKTQDELAEGDWREQSQRARIQSNIDTERSSVRLQAGIHGTMRVKVEL